MVPWETFATEAPELAAAGHQLLYQFGPGLAFLATVRADGGPRLHPICPLVVDGHLYAFIAASPKRADLLRDGRYALHSFPPEKVDDEFMLGGSAVPVSDDARYQAVDAIYLAQGTTHSPDDMLFELLIDRALTSTYRHRGDWPPERRVWRPGGDQ